MTRWKPDTCFCVVTFDAGLTNLKLEKKCRTHNLPQEVFVHNRSFNLRDGATPTPGQTESQIRDKIIEKAKPEFQRR